MSLDDQIYQRILAFIHRPVDESFAALAIQVFCYQFESVRAYRRYCEERGAIPRRCAG